MGRGAVGRARLPRGRVADGALAVGVFALSGVGSLPLARGTREEPWQATALSWTLMAVVCGALSVRRRHPVAVAAAVLAGSAAYYLTSTYDGPLMIAVVVALYTVAAEGHLRAAVALASVAVIGTGLGTLAGNRDVNGLSVFMLTGWLVAMVALGRLRHSRLAHAREVERRAATEERLRIARELHDVIGHHISLVNVQSAAALRRLRKNPASGAEQAEEALAAIKESSREALRELRATLGVLRQADESAPTGPLPGLDRLTDLAASARRTGLDVRIRAGGDTGPLPTEVDRAAYRIVQEALTNVTRHARASAVTIHVGRTPGEVTVEVTDDGQGPAPGGTPGSGIGGMRERARALGGDLAAGPREGGGFAVRARLPYGNGRQAGGSGTRQHENGVITRS
ncbi:sensor histidine kinase [Streptomyces ipomoeae]|uniref:sensor histidine kinase n=1 Tax=Streptomyces ipomoeae TaxID=103232 RepID=UPI001146773B|nr:sensor histidine kinase [Streptomyces ipomoeae]MDX2827690.1 sensor histidine kinase [Streptomyces ipomoeae]MDX2880260.1 sensor histidine kinase [Streptomyces ipomoeae]TQE26627.1 sensor histidine kinase [Streptomyces ipomoeae]